MCQEIIDKLKSATFTQLQLEKSLLEQAVKLKNELDGYLTKNQVRDIDSVIKALERK